MNELKIKWADLVLLAEKQQADLSITMDKIKDIRQLILKGESKEVKEK